MSLGTGVGGYLVEYGIAFPFLIAGSFAALSTLLSILFLPETLTKEKQEEARLNKHIHFNPFVQMIEYSKDIVRLFVYIGTLSSISESFILNRFSAYM
nr:hypothetical protein P5627_07710 [Bacillus safensis]